MDDVVCQDLTFVCGLNKTSIIHFSVRQNISKSCTEVQFLQIWSFPTEIWVWETFAVEWFTALVAVTFAIAKWGRILFRFSSGFERGWQRFSTWNAGSGGAGGPCSAALRSGTAGLVRPALSSDWDCWRTWRWWARQRPEASVRSDLWWPPLLRFSCQTGWSPLLVICLHQLEKTQLYFPPPSSFFLILKIFVRNEMRPYL